MGASNRGVGRRQGATAGRGRQGRGVQELGLGRRVSPRLHGSAREVIAKARVPIVKFVKTKSGIAFGFQFDDEKLLIMSKMSLEKRFGQSSVFVASTLVEYGGVPQSATPEFLLK